MRTLDRRWWIAIAALAVFLISFWINLTHVRATLFHPDESRWINRAHYLTDLKNPLGIEWGDRYLLRGQPPVGSYVTAIGLLLQGQDTDTNQPFDFTKGNERNTVWEAGHNAIPTSADLVAARRTNAFIGATVAALMVVILAKITSLAGGVVGGFFVLMNELLHYLSSTALSDATLALVIVLATLVTIRLVEHPNWGKTLLLGILLGLGTGAKLSPIVLALGLGAIGVAFLLRPWLRKVPGLDRFIDHLAAGAEDRANRLAWMLMSLPAITVATFVLIYPYVWSAPYERTRILYDFRASEMASQSRIWPNLAVIGRIDAFHTLWDVFQRDYPTTGRFFDWVAGWSGLPALPNIDVVLAGFGLAWAVVNVLRRGVVTPLAFVFIIFGGQALAIVAGLRVDFNRYYLPIVLFVGLCIGYLAGEMYRWLVARVNSPAVVSESSGVSDSAHRLQGR
ncbi:MAG: phospholipid carrier-dependent glycosyltransferase [Thermomicrobiales bacterium]|nr:phospholipid carrier-dependent glycosyltransferase [Thermomicrobiales bacterium]